MLANWRITRLNRLLQAGGVIAYPTEGVWGLGCNPWNGAAVERLLNLKQRPVHKGLILIAGEIEQFDFLLWDLPDGQLAKLRLSWPGPNTWLVPHQGRLPRTPSCVSCALSPGRWCRPRPIRLAALRRVRGCGSSSIFTVSWMPWCPVRWVARVIPVSFAICKPTKSYAAPEPLRGDST